jgi:hypothetical protein
MPDLSRRGFLIRAIAAPIVIAGAVPIRLTQLAPEPWPQLPLMPLGIIHDHFTDVWAYAMDGIMSEAIMTGRAELSADRIMAGVLEHERDFARRAKSYCESQDRIISEILHRHTVNIRA